MMLYWGLFWTILLTFLVLIFLIALAGAYPWVGLIVFAAVLFFWIRHRIRYPLPRNGRRH